MKITYEKWPDGSGKVTTEKVGGGTTNNDFTGW